MCFKRSDYYSQTEYIKLLKKPVKRFKLLMQENNITPIERPVECGSDAGIYIVTGQYYLKEDIDPLVNLTEGK